MSTNTYDKLKKYWVALLSGIVFLILGIMTIVGIAVWVPVAAHTTLGIILAALGGVVGVIELVEAVRLLRTPFKNK